MGPYIQLATFTHQQENKRDQRQCFPNFVAQLEIVQNIHTILGSDLIFYMSPGPDTIDNSPYYNDNRNFRANVCSFIETNNNADVWHTVNLDKRWH